MALYKSLGYVKVNRLARIGFWTREYREQRLRMFLWSLFFILLFAVITLAVIVAGMAAL